MGRNSYRGRPRNEHDDRTEMPHGEYGSSQILYRPPPQHYNANQAPYSNIKRVKKKFNYNNRGGRGAGGRHSGPPFVREDDVNMGGGAPSYGSQQNRSRFKPYQRSKSAQGGRYAVEDLRNAYRDRLPGMSDNRNNSRNDNYRARPRGYEQFYKIMIPNSKHLGKEFLLTSLKSMVHVPFIPISFAFENNSAVFHVDDSGVKNAVLACNHRITTPDGSKLAIKSGGTRSGPPSLTEDSINKLKEVMSSHYDVALRSLSLASFSKDQELKQNGISVPMDRAYIVIEIIKVIQENIPELEQLDLSLNNIRNLSLFKKLKDAAPALQKLDLSHNKINNVRELAHMESPNILQLRLEHNPLCDAYNGEKQYISAVRKYFPKVINLDGHDLDPPITFGVEISTSLPQPLGSYFGDESVKALTCRFLEQYYALYDSDSREGLINAYHEKALFSLCAAFNRASGSTTHPLSMYFIKGRNLLRKSTTGLKKGSRNIIDLLNDLPRTQHDPAAFVVDVSFASPTVMTFTVHGLFKEKSSQNLRSFARTFVTVQQGTGIVIVNEHYTITNATRSQSQVAFKTPAPTPSPSPVLQADNPAVPPAVPTVEQQQLLATQFSEKSGMNLAASAECLAQSGWDFMKAGNTFTELHAAGKIPPEYFIK